jgi:sugar phosphate isomerase/epimerase
MPLRRSLPEAQRLGAAGVSLTAWGDLAPQNLSQSGRREVRHLLESHNLELLALFCPLRHGLDVAEQQEVRLDFVRQVMTLAFDLGPRLVILQAGKVPEKPEEPGSVRLHDALDSLARHGDRTGTRLALDTGVDAPAKLTDFLALFDTGSLGVNYNPGQLLAGGHDPYEAPRVLRARMLHVDAQDARRVSPNRSATVPVGHGDIDWLLLLGALEEVEYRGALEVLGDDVAELAAGVALLHRFAAG